MSSLRFQTRLDPGEGWFIRIMDESGLSELWQRFINAMEWLLIHTKALSLSLSLSRTHARTLILADVHARTRTHTHKHTHIHHPLPESLPNIPQKLRPSLVVSYCLDASSLPSRSTLIPVTGCTHLNAHTHSNTHPYTESLTVSLITRLSLTQTLILTLTHSLIYQLTHSS